MIDLARMLADGRWHSGEALAHSLGVSRAAVWKRIATARANGLAVDAVRGRGYRLLQPFEPLDTESIRSRLSTDSYTVLEDLSVLGRIDSTNSHLLRSDARVAACVAEQQTAGRGRRGRDWCSPFGTNIYLSVAWTFESMPPAIGALSLAVGTAFAEVLRASGVGAIGLKWPNDLMVDGDKLGGILVEHRGEAAGGCRIVMGVGLNVQMTAGDAADLNQPWTSVASHVASAPSRNTLVGDMLNASLDTLRQFETAGFAPFEARWHEFDAVWGKYVHLWTEQRQLSGYAAGIAPDGALLVDIEGERQRFYSADVSVRAIE